MCGIFSSLDSGERSAQHKIVFKKMDRKQWNVIFLSVYLMILFSAEFAVLNMQKTIISSIHDEKPEFTVEGYFVTGIAYTVFSITVWLAPSLICILGPRLSMAVATLGYIFYLAAFSVEEAWTMYTGAVVVGVSEALLWTSQGNYLVLNSEPHTVNRNLGIFWVIFSSAELYGNMFVYYKLEGKKYIDAETRKAVIYVMSSVAAASLLMCAVLGKAKESLSGAHLEREGPVKALRNTWAIFNTTNMRKLCVTFVFIGMQQAFRCGIYSACVGFTLKFGDCAKQLVVLSGIFLGLGELLGGLYQICLSGFTKRYQYGQSVVLGTGLLCQLLSYLVICLNMPPSAVFGNTLEEPIIHASVPLAMACSLFLGLADCCCHTQMYSLMAVMYPDNSAQTCAIYKFTKGTMVAITFYCSNHLNLHQQVAVLVPMAIIANFSFFSVNKSVVKATRHSDIDHRLETMKNGLPSS